MSVGRLRPYLSPLDQAVLHALLPGDRAVTGAEQRHGSALIDAHCHAWRVWPYQPPVPDPDSRGLVEQLLYQMDQVGVDQAAIVCARIGDNSDNNDYVAGAVSRYPERLHQFADVDCMWTKTYHTPNAASRLESAVQRYALKGFTHYVRGDDDGTWFLSSEGTRFFETTARLNQIVSIALPWRLQPTLRKLAARFPTIPFLCHHLAGARVDDPASLKEILISAEIPNILIKVSGYHYASSGEYPYPECEAIICRLYEHFGARRLCWGSDYPVVRRAMTYRQSLDALRRHTPFIPDEDMALILGGNLHRLLAAQQPPSRFP